MINVFLFKVPSWHIHHFLRSQFWYDVYWYCNSTQNFMGKNMVKLPKCCVYIPHFSRYLEGLSHSFTSQRFSRRPKKGSAPLVAQQCPGMGDSLRIWNSSVDNIHCSVLNHWIVHVGCIGSSGFSWIFCYFISNSGFSAWWKAVWVSCWSIISFEHLT